MQDHARAAIPNVEQPQQPQRAELAGAPVPQPGEPPPPHHPHPLRQPQHATFVSSCDDDDSSLDDREDDVVVVPDDLFDANADDEDEAYVYKHLRSGVKETVNIVVAGAERAANHGTAHQHKGPPPPPPPGGGGQPPEPQHETTATTAAHTGQPPPPSQQQQLLLRPRTSDAVLSCPCCFTIVCMDCQQHERYSNQYRAMFVQSIVVHWDRRLTHDDATNRLVGMESGSLSVWNRPPNNSNDNNNERSQVVVDDDDDDEKQAVYYTVCCGNCDTQVAALDMTDEVYHFSGCLASC